MGLFCRLSSHSHPPVLAGCRTPRSLTSISIYLSCNCFKQRECRFTEESGEELQRVRRGSKVEHQQSISKDGNIFERLCKVTNVQTGKSAWLLNALVFWLFGTFWACISSIVKWLVSPPQFIPWFHNTLRKALAPRAPALLKTNHVNIITDQKNTSYQTLNI